MNKRGFFIAAYTIAALVTLAWVGMGVYGIYLKGAADPVELGDVLQIVGFSFGANTVVITIAVTLSSVFLNSRIDDHTKAYRHTKR